VRRTPRAEAIVNALPEEAVVGMAEDLLELVDRGITRRVARQGNAKRKQRTRDEARHIRAL